MHDRILIVDDDQLILLGFMTIRKRLGYEFEPAHSSRQALEMIRTSGPFDVVVSDWEMPGMDGLEFLRRCREQAPEMIRVMLSAQTENEAIQAAVREGLVFRFVPKPCTPHLLALHLQAALEERQRRNAMND